MPERVSGPPPSMLPGAALSSFAARFCWQGLWTVPERVSGPPPSMLPGAALSSLAARFCWQGQHFRLWTVPDAARRSTLEPRGSFLLAGAALQALDGARARLGEPRGSFLLAGAALQALNGARAHFGASRLVSAGRGSTSGSGRCPSAFRGPPPLDAARRSTFKLLSSLAARFCWQGQHLDGARPLDAARRSAALWSLAARFCWQGQHFRLWTVPERTLEPRGSFLLAGAALQALDGARARFEAPSLDAARRSTFELRGSFLLAGAALQALDGARFCWQGQHFRLWTVPERVSGPPPSMLPGAALWSLAARFCLFRGPPP